MSRSRSIRFLICFLAAAALTRAQKVDFVTVISKVVTRSVDLPAEVQPFLSVSLHARVPGYVDRVAVDRGSAVKQDDVLVELSAPEMAARIADDIWDGWDFHAQQFPNGILSAFDNLAKWAKFARPGNWPDADMLPWGSLTPHPGWGPPRQSRITEDEQRTQFTLWAISRSPLILGANLTRLDDFTRSLLTNREVIAIDQTAVSSAEIPGDSADAARLRVWSATTAGPQPKHYLAVFNLQESKLQKDIAWPSSPTGSAHTAYEIWTERNVPSATSLHVELPPHGCALFRME